MPLTAMQDGKDGGKFTPVKCAGSLATESEQHDETEPLANGGIERAPSLVTLGNGFCNARASAPP